MLVPELWQVIAGPFLELPPDQMDALWQAMPLALHTQMRYLLGKIESSTPYSEARGRAIDRLFRRLTPAVLIEAIEAAVREGRMTRTTANGLQDAILEEVQANGAWVDLFT